MILKRIKLKNIGPFNELSLNLVSEDQQAPPPVIIITGENGTGKSIVLDSIRTLFMGVFNKVERNIVASKDFLIEADLNINNKDYNIKVDSLNGQGELETNNMEINRLFISHLSSNIPKTFIFDYWTSKLSNDTFDITSIEALKPKNYLDNTLNGIHKNIDVTKIISFFDYLRDSKKESERRLGESIYEILERIIAISINDGGLSHVSRIDLKPIIRIQNREISLDKLSSGNIYLIQRLLSLLNQVYSICVNNDIPISEYKSIKGVLLIDEAENHLHPKWQKTFLNNILDIFPSLQIITSTHSPFIVSSVKNSKVFVCESKVDFSVIEEETNYYSNMPVEEILLSPLFNTNNFSTEISELLNKRKIAVLDKDDELLSLIEKELLVRNPEYFNYLNIESILKAIRK